MTVPKPTFKRYALTFLRNLLVGMVVVVVVGAFEPIRYGTSVWMFGVVLPTVIASALLAYASVLRADKAIWSNHRVEAEALADESAKRSAQQIERARAQVKRAQEEVEATIERAKSQEDFYRNAMMGRGGGLPTVVAMLEELDERQDEVVSRCGGTPTLVGVPRLLPSSSRRRTPAVLPGSQIWQKRALMV